MEYINAKKLCQTCLIISVMIATVILNLTLRSAEGVIIMRVINIALTVLSMCAAIVLGIKSHIVHCDSIDDVMDVAEENFCDRNNSKLLALASIGFLIWAL